MLAVFVSYVSAIWIKYGIQKSISDSYYALPEQLRFLFTFFCWGFALPAIIVGVEVTPLMFFAGVGIAFVGAAAQIHDNFVAKVHNITAISGILFSQLAIYFGYHLLWLNIISLSLIALIYFFIKKNYIWWIEIVAFTAISIALGTAVF